MKETTNDVLRELVKQIDAENLRLARNNCGSVVRQVYPSSELMMDCLEYDQYLSIWALDGILVQASSENIFDAESPIYMHEYRHV